MTCDIKDMDLLNFIIQGNGEKVRDGWSFSRGKTYSDSEFEEFSENMKKDEDIKEDQPEKDENP